jgi:hypothetical protein
MEDTRRNEVDSAAAGAWKLGLLISSYLTWITRHLSATGFEDSSHK